MSCLSVKVKLVNPLFDIRVKKICGFGFNFFPLLVDDGYLFVESKNGILPIFVMKK